MLVTVVAAVAAWVVAVLVVLMPRPMLAQLVCRQLVAKVAKAMPVVAPVVLAALAARAQLVRRHLPTVQPTYLMLFTWVVVVHLVHLVQVVVVVVIVVPLASLTVALVVQVVAVVLVATVAALYIFMQMSLTTLAQLLVMVLLAQP